jgi:hypothetical protein
MTTALGSPLADLIRGALADLGAGPGVLADWLEENGDARGVLLRRRWKRWQREMAAATKDDLRWTAQEESVYDRVIRKVITFFGGTAILPPEKWGFRTNVIRSFERYVRRRFPEAAP